MGLGYIITEYRVVQDFLHLQHVGIFGCQKGGFECWRQSGRAHVLAHVPRLLVNSLPSLAICFIDMF